MIPWQIPFLSFWNRMRDGLVTEITMPTNPIHIFFTNNGQAGRWLLWGFPLSATLILRAHFPGWQHNFLYYAFMWFMAFAGAACADWGLVDHPIASKTTGKPVWTLKNLLSLGWWGLVFTGFPALITAVTNMHLAVALLVSGLMIIPAYVLGWTIPSKIPGFSQGTLLGSTLFGGFIGLFIYLSRYWN